MHNYGIVLLGLRPLRNNEILGYLGTSTQIIICNPNPPKDMEVYVRSRFHQVEILTADLPD